MITNLRNDLYDTILRKSTAFFQRHTTGSLISTYDQRPLSACR